VGVWFCACGSFVTTTLPSGRVTVRTVGGAAARLRPGDAAGVATARLRAGVAVEAAARLRPVVLGEATARLRPVVLGEETARRLVEVDAAGVATARLRPAVASAAAAALFVVPFVLGAVVAAAVVVSVEGCASETPFAVVVRAVPTRTPADPLTTFVVPVAVRLFVVLVTSLRFAVAPVLVVTVFAVAFSDRFCTAFVPTTTPVDAAVGATGAPTPATVAPGMRPAAPMFAGRERSFVMPVTTGEVTDVPATVVVPVVAAVVPFVAAVVPVIADVVGTAAVVPVMAEVVPATVEAAVMPLVAAVAPVVTPVAGAAMEATAPVSTKIAPASPPAPEVIAGVGGELIEELTVICGLAVSDGEMNWPVTTGGPLLAEAGPGLAGPRTTPVWPWCAAMTAAASEADIIGWTPVVEAEPWVVVVPPEVPGVVAPLPGPTAGAVDGVPSPGVLFVVHPKAARASESESAATPRNAFRSLVEVVRFSLLILISLSVASEVIQSKGCTKFSAED
jgi:hypothetical protein